MKNRWIAAWLLGFAGAAGAQAIKSAPPPNIVVQVSDGRISVSPSGMKAPAGQTTLTWVLRTSGYRFAAGGVNFGDASSYFSCSIVNSGQGVRCTKSAQAPSGELPYSITVESSSGTVESDPGILIFND